MDAFVLIRNDGQNVRRLKTIGFEKGPISGSGTNTSTDHYHMHPWEVDCD